MQLKILLHNSITFVKAQILYNYLFLEKIIVTHDLYQICGRNKFVQ